MTCSLEIRLRTTGALAYATNASAHSSSRARTHSALVRRLGRSPRTSRANGDGDVDGDVDGDDDGVDKSRLLLAPTVSVGTGRGAGARAHAASSGVSAASWLEATRETEEREKSHASEWSSKHAIRGTSVMWFTKAKFPLMISINYKREHFCVQLCAAFEIESGDH